MCEWKKPPIGAGDLAWLMIPTILVVSIILMVLEML